MFGHNLRSGYSRYYVCQQKKKLAAAACTTKPLPTDESEASVIDLSQWEVLSPCCLRDLLDLVNERAAQLGDLAWAETVAGYLN